MAQLLLQVLPFFAPIGLGSLAARAGLFDERAGKALTDFVFCFALSALPVLQVLTVDLVVFSSLIVTLFPVPAETARLIVAAAALPVAGNVFILVQPYGVAPQRASTAILVSTIVGIATLTATLALTARAAPGSVGPRRSQKGKGPRWKRKPKTPVSGARRGSIPMPRMLAAWT